MKRSISKFVRFVTPNEEGAGGELSPVITDSTSNPPEGRETSDEGKDSDDDTSDEDEDEDGPGWDPDRARRKIRKANAEAQALRERTKTAEAKAAAADQATQELDAAKAENLRLRVALKFGLDEKIAKRLQGATEEELLQDAEELLSFMAPATPKSKPTPKLSGSQKQGTPEVDLPEDLDKVAAEMFRR